MCPIATSPSEAVQLLLVEDLGDEAHVAQDGQAALVRDRDPGRLLAPVLEREEPEVGHARDVSLGRADPEDAASAVTSLSQVVFSGGETKPGKDAGSCVAVGYGRS